VLPERPEPLQGVTTAGGQAVRHLPEGRVDARVVHGSTARSSTRSSSRARRGGGDSAGTARREFVFYTFNSLNVPPTIYRYDIASRRAASSVRPEVPGYDPTKFETKQVFYTSKDGTRVPMFLVHKKGLKLDGNNPTLLYGYGGFNITQAPDVQRARLALLEQGGVYAWRTSAAAASTARRGTRPARSSRSRTCSTTSSPRPSG
jgi:prolyl oligopeptidase